MTVAWPLLVAVAHAGVVSGVARDLDAAYAPRRVAVVVGVQDYADPALQGLRFPTKDALDLGRVLQDPAVGAFDRVFVIEGQQATTAEGIRRAIAIATADLQRDDTFLLYLSGHGTLSLDAREGSRLWFLPSDGLLDDPDHTGISIASLEEQLGELVARRRVLILDTCHNGRMAGGRPEAGRAGSGGLVGRAALNSATAQLVAGLRGEPPAPRALREVAESEARLFAAQVHQPAMEDPALENGVYTHYLIEALTEERGSADLDRDGLVDVTEAHDWARDHTITRTAGIQVPRAEYRIVGREEIYLSGDPQRRSRAEQALLAACDELLAGAKLLVDGIPRGAVMGLTPVEPGRHLIELQDADGRSIARGRVDLEAGNTWSVENLLRDDRAARPYVALGAMVRHGEGEGAFHPYSGELELGLLDPSAGARWGSGVHLRVSGMEGPIAEQPIAAKAGLPVFTGELGLGGMVGWRWGGLHLGPEAELLVPVRAFTNETGAHRQATLTGALGARAAWVLPVGERGLLVRYDARYAPFEHDTSWTSLWHHGLAVGIAAR